MEDRWNMCSGPARMNKKHHLYITNQGKLFHAVECNTRVNYKAQSPILIGIDSSWCLSLS